VTAPLLAVGVLLLLANAIFVAAEFAFVAARQPRLQALGAQGEGRAGVAQAAMRDLPRTLAATQLGITMASIGLGFTTEAALESSVVPLLEDALPVPDALLQVVAGGLSLGVVISAHTLLGEMVPKNLAIAAPERSALWLAPLIRPFALTMRPPVHLLTAASNALLRALGVEPRSELDTAHSVEDVADMVELAGREGTIDGAERELLDRAIRFAGMQVEQVMVPWEQVTSVEESMSRAEMREIAIRAGHSRLPVLRDREVLGFVHVLDLQRPATELPLQPVLRVPPPRRLMELFEDLRLQSRRLAVVTDEVGQAVGLVTLEDLLAELLGEELESAA
jgi:CBS domain containing-hemolysin-like protein